MTDPSVALAQTRREFAGAPRAVTNKNYLAAIDAVSMLREDQIELCDRNVELAGELEEQRQRTEHYADAADRARAERHGLQEALDGANERIASLQHELAHQRGIGAALYRELKATCNAAAEALEPFITHEWLSDVPASAFQRAQALHDQLAEKFE